MSSLTQLEQEIREIIAGSSVPEDPVHAENTVEWVKRLKPDAKEPLLMAALAHDIERAVEDRKVRRSDFSSYEEFKEAHASNSARIVRELMEKHGLELSLIEQVTHPIRHHETGGDPESDILKEADAISFFEVNLPFYYSREGFENTLQRSIWGYRRISEKNRHFLQSLKYENENLNRILQITLADQCAVGRDKEV